MDPLIRLGIAMWRLLQRRPGKRHLMLYGVVAGMSLTIALIEWLGYWPAAWRTSAPTRDFHRAIR